MYKYFSRLKPEFSTRVKVDGSSTYSIYFHPAVSHPSSDEPQPTGATCSPEAAPAMAKMPCTKLGSGPLFYRAFANPRSLSCPFVQKSLDAKRLRPLG